ncbi:S8 family serine peptidase [Streptomyces sp. KM273126]|uniref:S8 family serine peptidase n=1 Tax=Streptomyces sp. KM273126 TaxID=2545247 RepID=UPI001039F53C|nr:S8 family serine peptidase [Streptomyces sp. KM273126]MBA2809110.1 S8 family serine peptidase [Streptomyces sp. KM273126]
MTGRTTSGSALAGRALAAVAALALTLAMPGKAAPAVSGALRDSEWALTSLKAEQAWKITKGEGVTVAVIGTGVDASHPDLKGRVISGSDVYNTRDEGSETFQGTYAAGIIAGTGRNYRGDGLVGLAPEARILPFRVFLDNTSPTNATAKSIRAAARQGARVIDVTVGFRRSSPALKAAVEYAVRHGALVVAGAGDTGGTGNAQTYPAAYPEVLSVTAIDKKGALWPDAHRGKHVDLAAPGVDILTTARNDDYWTGSGTGFAASWVSASAALVRAQHPKWTVDQVTRRLTETATPRGRGQGSAIVAPAAALPQRAALSDSASTVSADKDAAATRSSDTGPIMVVSAATGALIVLAAVSWFLIRRTVSTTDDG